MRKLSVTSACFVALMIAGGCSKEPEVVETTVDPEAKELAQAPPVTLPPAIRESKTYRCKDNSLVYASFMDDDLTVIVRDKQEEPPLATLKAPEPGKPFVADGFSLSGSGASVTYTSPDSGTLTCKA